MERLMTYLMKCVSSFLALVLLVRCAYFASALKDNEDVGSCPVYTSGDPEGHMIALTFDDGPHPTKTTEILDILKANEVIATFFVVGDNALKNEEIVERICREGHEIGNHTLSHKYLSGEQVGTMEREIDFCDDIIYNHSEYHTTVFRPPGGLYDASLASVCLRRGYSIVLWSIDTRDWEGKSAFEICREVYNNVHDGSIILMHDYICAESHTAEALRTMIPKLKELGYRFVTVSELIGD